MVSARLKKRLIALVFLGSIAVVFLYKIQAQHSDYIAGGFTGGFKQTKDFSRWVLCTRSVRCYIAYLVAQHRVSIHTIATLMVFCLQARFTAQRLTLKVVLCSQQLLSWRVLKLILGSYVFSIHSSIESVQIRWFMASMCLWNFHYLVLHFTNHPQFSVLKKILLVSGDEITSLPAGNRAGSQTHFIDHWKLH